MTKTSLPTSRKAVICKLPAFPGRNEHSKAVESEELRLSAPSTLPLSAATIEAGWSATLCLYTNLSQICFQSKAANAKIASRLCDILETTELRSISTNLRSHENGSDLVEQNQSNTAIIYIDGEHLVSTDKDPIQASGGPNKFLWQEIDLALLVEPSAYTLIFRHNFMSNPEARNFGATLSSTLDALLETKSTKLFKDLTISQQDLKNIIAWNKIDFIPKKSLVHTEFSKVADSQPDAEAIDAWDGRLTYKELDDVSTDISRELRRRGVRVGSWVLVCFHKSRWSIASMLAVLKAGAAFVPIDPRFPESRIRQIINVTNATHVVVAEGDLAALLKRSSQELQVVQVTQLSVQGPSTDKQVEDHLPQPHDPAICLFTSGSTGIPKGIIASHAAVCTGAWEFGRIGNANPADRMLQFASYTFDMSYADIITALLHGSTLCIPSEDDRMGNLQEFIQRSRPTWANLTPTVARLLDPAVCRTIRKLLLGGELVKESDIAGWIDGGAEVYNVYGPAENVLILNFGRIFKGAAYNTTRPRNARVWVAEMDKRRILPVGAIGELISEGPQVADGYLNDPTRTAASFLLDVDFFPNPTPEQSSPRRFYRSGDLARQFADGSFEVIGRADSQVKVGGQRIELSDIEAHIKSCRAAVVLPKKGPLANRLTAILQTQRTPDVDDSYFTPLNSAFIEETRKKLSESLPPYMIPSHWLGIDKFPYSTSSKLDRKLLLNEVEILSQDQSMHLTQIDGDLQAHQTVSLNERQEILQEICGQVFNLPKDRVIMTHSFTKFGGDSITAMQISSATRRAGLGFLSVKHILTSKSLLDVADQISEQTSSRLEIPVIEEQQLFHLSPMQQFFVETAHSSLAWHHYNQNVLLRLTVAVQPKLVEQALADIIQRHPMLRARFRASSDGEWMQYIATATDCDFQLELISDDLSRDEQKQRMLHARQSLNLFDGPIVRAQLFEKPAEKHSLLFIVAHHIVIDLVSWRVIVEELEASIAALTKADSQAIAPVLRDRSQSMPFSAWVELQRRHSRRLFPAQTIPYGLSVPATDFSFWGISSSQNVYSDVQEIRIALDSTLTSQLLHDCHRALRTEPVDLLLASIFISFSKAFPEYALPPIFNESHGREPWNDRIDISQTVGWFTVVSPILLKNVNTDDTVDVVRRVKDWRRAMPAKGFEYFSSKYLTEGRSAYKNHLPAEILFNYEGRYQSLEKEDAILKPESWTAGEELADMGPNLQRFCLFELSAAVLSDGKLHLTGAWNSKTRHQSRISSWLESALPSVLQDVVGSLLNEREQLTLDDIGKRSTMDYSEIDSLAQTILAIPEVEYLGDVEAILDGSPMQDSLALSQLKTTNLDAYEIDFTWEVTTDHTEGAGRSIDSHQLLAAWRETVAAHSTLRTVFLESASATGSEAIYQIVLKEHMPCSVLLKAEDSQDALQQLNNYTSYRDQGLFPDRKPPHRLLICSTSDKRTFVRLQVNHIIFDGMSQLPLLQSLSRAYGQGVLVLDSTRNTFVEFIRYIRDPERRNSSLLYWKDHLNGVKPCLFPHLLDARMDKESPKSQKPQRCHAPVPLEVNLSEIQRVAGNLQVTIPTLVHLAWALVLRLYTGETHAVFGYLASGRDAPLDGIEDAIGPFIAMLVCFVDFGQDVNSSLVELMNWMQECSADAIAHQGTSLAEIQSAIGLPGNSLLFNSGISFLPKLSPQSQIDRGQDLIFETITEKDPTEFDLSLFVEVDDIDGQIEMHFDFLGSAFGSEHIKNVAGSLSHMLSELVRDPHQSLRDILKPGKRDMTSLLQWNSPLITPLEKCAHEIFAERVQAFPDREAIYSWDGTMTYKQLDDASTCIGRHLLQYSIGPETLVPVCFEKSLWTVVAILGILKAGGAFVLLDPAHPEERLWNLINELEASVVVCSPLIAESRGFRLRAATETKTISVVEIDQGLVDQLLSSGQHELDKVPICDSVKPENLMYAVFTSGTTGKPKGTLITHRGLATGLREHAVATGMTLLGPDTRSLQFASYSFDASIGDIFTTIEVGGCLCIPREEDRSPVEITAFVARSRATWAGITPSFAAILDPLSVSTLKALCLAGEPLSVQQVNAWASRLQLINMYGPTECTIACVSHSAVTREIGASNIGRGYRCATWVVDENNHDILRPVGVIGELLIEGPILARGYLKRPETTAAVFIDSPEWLKGFRPDSKLYKTGDLVRYNSDGTLNFIGRKDTQIKINGQRVEVGEIETVLSTSLDRDDSPIIVDLLKRASLGESDMLVCFVCVRPDSEPSKESFASEELIPTDADSIEKLRSVVAKILRQPSTTSSLPRYMLPQAYIPINKIPLSTSGKTDRRALQVATSALARARLVGYTAALTISTDGDDLETDEEVLLGELWEKVLNIQVTSKRSNFHNLGGDSMIAMRLRAECRRVGIDLSVAEIFANPDLIDMASLLTSTSTTISSTASSNLVSSSASTNASTISGGSCSEPFSLVRHLDIKFDDELLQEISAECSLSVEDIEDIYPCSPMQEALMAISSSDPKQQAYCLHAAFTLPLEMDVSRFLLAWEQTSIRFAMMRSRIILRPHGSFIVVARSAPAAYSVIGKSCAEQIASQRTQAFSYGSPLLRLGVVSGEQGGPNSLIIGVHHAAYDGWSMKLIWDTVIGSFRGDPGPTHARPSFQSFIRELNLKSNLPSEHYWKNQLISQDENGFRWPPVASSHKPSTSSSKTFRFDYSAQASRNLSVTSADLVNAVWAMTLARYSDSTLVSYGVTLSGRDIALPDIENIVGPTIATVPRQIEVRHDMSLADYLRSLQQVTNSARPHQHLGLQKIQSLSPAAREACDFNTLLVITPASLTDNSSLSEIGIVPLPIDSADFHPYPLVLECSIEDGSLKMEAAFDPHCIDESTLTLAMQQFDHILQNVSGCTSDSSLRDIGSLMDTAPSHIDAILDFNSSQSKGFLPRLVHEIVEQTAHEQPSDMAIMSHDGTLTYQQLDEFANILAQDILEREPQNSESLFVGLYIEKSAAALVSMLAILKAGCAFVPFDPTQPASRLEALVDTARVQIILTSPSHAHRLSDIFTNRCVLQVELSALSQSSPRPSASSQCHTQASPAAQLAYLLYTSGTTGRPKGVEIDHAAWSSAIAFQKDYFKLSRTTRMLQFSNFTFDVSLFEIFTTLAAGGCVCVPSEQARMDDLTASILEMKVNVLSLTPTVARILDGGKLTDVKLLVFAGEALAQPDIDAWVQPGRRIVNAYGPTEACIYATARDIVQGGHQKSSRNIGKGLGVDVWVMRPESNTLAPIGAVGELHLSGQQLARGYLGMEEATLRSFSTQSFGIAHGSMRTARFYRTGDLVRYASDGSLEFLGRRDGQVKIRGQRIDVGEVQHHIQKSMAADKLFRHCTVQLCYPSFGSSQHGCAKTDPVLVAFLVMELDFVDALSGVRFSHLRTTSADYPNRIASKLQHSLRAVLPSFMVPSIFIALDRLPNTASGKLDRGFISTCLGSLNLESSNRDSTEILHPLNAKEDMLRDWWERLLGAQKSLVTVNSDFFSLGGNSLSAIKLVSLARSLGYKTTFSAIFSNPRLSDMAVHIEPESEDAVTSEIPLNVPVSAQFDLISETEAQSAIHYTLPKYGIEFADVEDIYPATPFQEGSMASTARTPYAYLLIAHMDIPTSDMKILKRSWESAFQRFELLRTRMIPGHDGSALQVVMKSSALTWEEVPDIKTFAKYVYDNHDYGQPLARVGFVKAAPSLQDAKEPSGTVTVLFSASHGLYDGWSLYMIWSRLFSSPSTENDDNCGDRATPFKEFIRYQAALDPADAITFWQKKLEGASGAEFPEKPADIAANYVPMASSSIKQKLPLPTPDDIRQSGATVATIAQAAWALTVSHFSGSSDVIFKTILSGRATAAAVVPGIEEMAGPTAVLIPCRTRIDHSLSISSFLAQCHDGHLKTIPYAHIGSERISRIDEDCNKACKLHSLFNFQAVAFDDLDAQAAGVYSPRVYENLKGFSPNALNVDLATLVGGKEILVTFHYDPVILHSSQVESIMATFITLFEQMVHKPSSTPVGDLSTLSQSHMWTRQAQQVGFNGKTDTNAALSGSYLQHLVRQHVDRNPFHHAIESWHDSMTYMQLEDYSNSLAERLVRQGVRSNQAIGLVLDKSPWVIVAILGVLKAGGYVMPIDPSTDSSSLPALLHHAKTSTVLVSPAYASIFSGCRCIVVAAETLPTPTTAFLKPAFRSPRPPTASDYAFTFQSFSADTGSAPGYVTQGELCAAIFQVGEQMAMDTEIRSLLYNESWSTTMLVDILAPLAYGGTICCSPLGSSISNVGESITYFGVNAFTIPVAVSRILEPNDMPALRQVCLYGDIPTRHDVARWNQRARLFLAWGVAEMGTIAFLGSPSQSQHGEFVGAAMGSCASVVNPHTFSERLSPGAIGILKLQHFSLSSTQAGQINTEGLQRFRANADRTLTLIESAAERKLTVNGHRIKVRDIEDAIQQHLPSSSDVVVDLYAPQILGTDLRLGAVVTASRTAPWTSEQGAATNLAGQLATDLRPKLNASVSPTSIPSFFTALSAFPLTTAGHIDRTRLQELVRDAPADSLAISPEIHGYDAPLSSSERLLASLWIKTLNLDQSTELSRHDQFFDDCRGNEVRALRLCAELKRHNWLLHVPTMFDHPTLGEMAAAMQPDGSPSQLPRCGH